MPNFARALHGVFVKGREIGRHLGPDPIRPAERDTMGQNMKKTRWILGGVTAFFALLCALEAYKVWKGWDGPGTMVLIVGGIFAIISVIFFLFPSRETATKWPDRKELIRMGVIGGSFALYINFMEWVGYLLGTWLFLAVIAKYISPSRLSVILIWTGAVAIGTYIIFKKYLFMYLPAGFIGI